MSHHPPKTLRDWCTVAYENSKAHGWHDDPLDGKSERKPIRIALLHSEVSELLEAFRDNPWLSADKPGLILSRAAEELADIMIRLFDFVVEFKHNDAFDRDCVDGAQTFPFLIQVAQRYTYASEEIGAEICRMHTAIGMLDSKPHHAINLLACDCARFAVHHNIDLENAVKIKHAFNKTRSHKHGGRAF